MKKYALDLLPGKLTSSQYSHKFGWAMLRKCQLEDALNIEIDVLHGESWDDYDTIFLYHSMEQDGETLNLFGGATKENAVFFERILTHKNKSLVSLDIPMPDYGRLCKNRLKNADEYWSAIDWDALSNVCNSIPEMLHPVVTTKLVLGDSHSFSAYQPGYMTFRKDGRTLAGVLRKTITKEIDDFMPGLKENLTHLTCYYGNIDIRHHICREENPTQYVDDLVSEYENQIKVLNIKNIEVVLPLPIEDETRKLPKTGWYKGTPFFGSRQERDSIRQYFTDALIEMCNRNNWSVFKWPEQFYTYSPIDFMQTCMEKPKSVHLAPVNHRFDYWNKGIKQKESTLEDFF
jgi:hypothetical protein